MWQGIFRRKQRIVESLIKDVSDTAFMIAAFREIETNRRDPLFRDPLAARLSGELGRKIAAARPLASVVAWIVSLRTVIIDDFIRSALDQGVDTVLNLGAGLDTRPYRMDLPESLRWVEVDFPHMIEFKESRLSGEKARCCWNPQSLRRKVRILRFRLGEHRPHGGPSLLPGRHRSPRYQAGHSRGRHPAQDPLRPRPVHQPAPGQAVPQRRDPAMNSYCCESFKLPPPQLIESPW